MKNIETRRTKIGPDDAGLTTVLLMAARLEERKGRADVTASRLEVLAAHIVSGEMGHREAAELLRQEAEKYRNEAAEIH
ncbi:hypothetical protein TUM17576_50260 [Enterobacter hormaechei]|nr:DUF2732 family protein [Enterobacter hormaechei]GJL38206.1 hypothetical protein TUM17576_50260 [Enterobacter hormaechei]